MVLLLPASFFMSKFSNVLKQLLKREHLALLIGNLIRSATSLLYVHHSSNFDDDVYTLLNATTRRLCPGLH